MSGTRVPALVNNSYRMKAGDADTFLQFAPGAVNVGVQLEPAYKFLDSTTVGVQKTDTGAGIVTIFEPSTLTITRYLNYGGATMVFRSDGKLWWLVSMV